MNTKTAIKVYFYIYVAICILFFFYEIKRFSINYDIAYDPTKVIPNKVRFFYLLPLYLNNAWFIIYNFIFNWKKIKEIKIKKWTYVLFSILLVCFIRGIITNPISERAILDVVKPFFFLLVFYLFFALYPYYKDFFRDFFKKTARVFLFLVIIFGLIIAILIYNNLLHPGVFYPILFPLSYFTAFTNYPLVGLLLILIFLQGRRGIVLALLPQIIFLASLIGRKILFKRKILFVGIVVISIGLSIVGMNKFKNTTGYKKYEKSLCYLTKSIEKGDIELFDKFTTRRFAEVYSAFYTFDFIDYIIGKGVGYTYEFWDINREELRQKKRGNLHFSPLSLVMSYGVVFMVLFYGVFARCLVKGFLFSKKHKDKFILTFCFIAFSYFIKSFTEFNLFISFFAPISLGIIEGQLRSEKK